MICPFQMQGKKQRTIEFLGYDFLFLFCEQIVSLVWSGIFVYNRFGRVAFGVLNQKYCFSTKNYCI